MIDTSHDLPADVLSQLESDAVQRGMHPEVYLRHLLTLGRLEGPELEREIARRLAVSQAIEARMRDSLPATVPPEPPDLYRMEKNQRAIAMLRQWSAEDQANPEPGPVPEIPPLVLREVEVE